MTVFGLWCCAGFSLVVESEGYSSCAALTSHCSSQCTSLVAKYRLLSTRASVVAAHGLSNGGSWALEHRLSSFGTCA